MFCFQHYFTSRCVCGCVCVCMCVCASSYQMMSTVGRRKQVKRVEEHDDGFLSSGATQQFLKVRTKWRQLQGK